MEGSTDPMAHATMSATSRSYSSLALLDESEHANSPHVSVQDTTMFSPSCGGRVKTEDESSTSVSGGPSRQGLMLISEDEFRQGGQVEDEETTCVIVSTQSTVENGSVLSSETWTHNNVTYQQHLQHQQQQSPFGSFFQQPQSQSAQAPLPGIKEISGFASLSDQSSIVGRNHYHLGPQGVHSQYMGLYASAHYAAPVVGPLPLSHGYPVAVGFQEIPLPKRRRDRRSSHSQQPYGATRDYDASRQRSGFKVEDPSDESELLDSTSLNVKSESFKQEQDNEAGSDGPGALSHRRQEPLERDPDPKACKNCQTTSTPSWRRCPKGRILLCNACGLYQKLHGKSRPHYTAKDGTIKIQRTIPEHAPCVQCHTRNSPSWKKGPHGEAICHPCSTTMKSRSQSKAKRIEYPGPVESMSAGMGGMVGMYAGDASGVEYSEAISMRGSHAHGLGIEAGGEGSYGDVENMHQQQRRSRHSSSSRHSTKTSQQSYLMDNHSSRQGTNQYQGGRSFVYGISQVTPAYGLAQYGGYDASGYSLASLHTYPSSPGGWQPDVAAYGSGAYSEAFTFESSPPQQGQPSLQRGAMGSFRAESSSPSSAIPLASQSSPEGHQLLVPYNRSSQASYLAWEQAQQDRLSQPSLHSFTWGSTGDGGSGSGGGQAVGMSPELSFSQDQHQHHNRMFLFNQRSTPASSGHSVFAVSTSNEALRLDRYQGLQYQHQQQQHAHQDTSFVHQPSIHFQHQPHQRHQQQPQQHIYRAGSGYDQQQQQQQAHYHSYPYTTLASSVQNQNRSHSPNQDQKNNQDYEAALQSYVQGGGGGGAGGYDETSTMAPAHPVSTTGGTIADVSGGVQEQQQQQADQVSGTTVPSMPPTHTDLGVQTEPLDQANPVGLHSDIVSTAAASMEDTNETSSSSNLEAMAAETLASTFFDRQSSAPAPTPSPAPESSTSSRTAAAAVVPTIVVSESKKPKKSGSSAVKGMSEENRSSSSLSSASHRQQQRQHGSVASSTSGRSASAPALMPLPALMHSAIPDEAGNGSGSGDGRPRRSDRHRITSAGTSTPTTAAAGGTPKPVKRQEGLMSQHLNRRH
ncbi:hypothetical protein BGW39_010143 [Mortierella sp. 14UC]|nr:hypothetical protein BGW39_010143 [Mortierella sp. 14UC]